MLDVEKLGEPCCPLGDKRGFRHDDKRGQLQMRDDESSDDRFPEPGWGREDSVVVLEQLVGSMLLLGTKDAAELGRNVSACVSLVAIGVTDADFIEQLKQALLASSWKGDMPLAGFAEEDHAVFPVDRLVHGLGAIELGVGECGQASDGVGGLGVKSRFGDVDHVGLDDVDGLREVASRKRFA